MSQAKHGSPPLDQTPVELLYIFVQVIHFKKRKESSPPMSLFVVQEYRMITKVCST